MKYTLLKTASATAKKNGLQLCKNEYKRNFLIDLSLIDAVDIPEGFKSYAKNEVVKDLLSNFDFSYISYKPSEAEGIATKILFKIYTVSTEEKNNIYKICQAVKMEYCHCTVDPWTGEKSVINKFTKAIGTDDRPENINI